MTFEEEWLEWRQLREAGLRNPHGYLAITGLHWLSEVPQRFDDVPGAWTVSDSGVSVDLGDTEALLVDERVVTGRHDFGPVDGSGVIATWDDAVVEIADRFGSAVLRPRHPDGPYLRHYTGTPTYEPNASWQVTARFEAYVAQRPIQVGSVVEGRSSQMDAIGEVVFEAGGRPQRLVAFDGGDGELWLLFTDETSGVTTYAACRQLGTAPPVDDTVVLDFNRAANMPCAYTDYATCPLPPATNHIDVLVEAGEQIPPVYNR